ncbi:uncharacterized protein A4U43_C01F17010 [Asparagus officinalis]|uniref:Uncharacterized protein n=1 Tax=Asparagus officinalis TaxID=4686 RepID=A0A5P1FSG8_ASPOF|nr:uncharacterized protein A4U43_C01F17010 [Asparagus officinalis]
MSVSRTAAAVTRVAAARPPPSPYLARRRLLARRLRRPAVPCLPSCLAVTPAPAPVTARLPIRPLARPPSAVWAAAAFRTYAATDPTSVCRLSGGRWPPTVRYARRLPPPGPPTGTAPSPARYWVVRLVVRSHSYASPVIWRPTVVGSARSAGHPTVCPRSVAAAL